MIKDVRTYKGGSTMRLFKISQLVLVAVCLTTALLSAMTGVAMAAPKLLLSEAEQTELKELLKHVKYEASGIDGKPTVRVIEANVQILSGAGSEEVLNGEGNLIIGYDAEPRVLQTGSNNLVIGENPNASYSSYGSVIGGGGNIDREPYSVVFGADDAAYGPDSDVFGYDNAAFAEASSVTGGSGNEAKGFGSSVSGGFKNIAEAQEASALGGADNLATGEYSSVSGGYGNSAEAIKSAVGGGTGNRAIGLGSWLGGGELNNAEAEWSTISGGAVNKVTSTGFAASVFGGREKKATEEFEAVL